MTSTLRGRKGAGGGCMHKFLGSRLTTSAVALIRDIAGRSFRLFGTSGVL